MPGRQLAANSRIDVDALYGPLVLWAIQSWQKPGQALHLALDTTVLWNCCCVVVLSVVCHGRAILLLWQTLEHPSASVSAEVVFRENLNQHYTPLREANPTVHAAVRQGIEEADQISGCSRTLERRRGQGSGAGPHQQNPVRDPLGMRSGVKTPRRRTPYLKAHR